MPVRGGNRLRQVIADQKKPPEVQGVAVGFFRFGPVSRWNASHQRCGLERIRHQRQ